MIEATEEGQIIFDGSDSSNAEPVRLHDRKTVAPCIPQIG